MTALVNFMSSSAGRATRFVAGIVILILGLLIGSAWAWILGVIGLVMVAAGLFDFCLFAPLAGLPFGGKAIRARQA